MFVSLEVLKGLVQDVNNSDSFVFTNWKWHPYNFGCQKVIQMKPWQLLFQCLVIIRYLGQVNNLLMTETQIDDISNLRKSIVGPGLTVNSDGP